MASHGHTTQRRARLHVALAALLWATTGLAGVLAPAGTTAAALAEVRVLLGGLALASVVWLRGGARTLAAAVGWPVVLASLALAGFQWCFFAAARSAGSGVAAVVSTGVAPFASDLLAALRARGWFETRGRRVLVSLALTAGAGSLLAARASLDPLLFGSLAAVASGIAYTGYTELAAQFQRSTASDPDPDASLALTALALLGAAAALAPAAIGDLHTLASLHGAISATYLGLVATAWPYAAFVRGLRVLQAGDALILLFLQPIAAAALGWLALGERLNAPTALGVLALLAAAALRSLRTHRYQEKTP